MRSSYLLDDFLQPLSVDATKLHSLAHALCEAFKNLARESANQFLPTPISESLLRPSRHENGRYLAIDIGGTNLRAGIIELFGQPQYHAYDQNPNGNDGSGNRSRVELHLEKSWPIGEHLKNEKAEDLFTWIGKCIVEVVQDACTKWPGEWTTEIPMGVTFSFPMIQRTLADATLMSMGKGFAITSNLDLRKQLLQGYVSSLPTDISLPRIKIVAIANDTVATLVSFCFQENRLDRKAAMALIGGTGSNATIPMAPSILHPSKRQPPSRAEAPAPTRTSSSALNVILNFSDPVLPLSFKEREEKIVVNTEWSINGAAQPLYALNFITEWDQTLDAQGEAPGFQPFEYMTSGRYLGELGRLVILEFFIKHFEMDISDIPPKLHQRHGVTTAFLGSINLNILSTTMKRLHEELPPPKDSGWIWTPESANIVCKVAKKIQFRAAGMTAAAVIGLLGCTGELELSPNTLRFPPLRPSRTELTDIIMPMPRSHASLLVGYTGGCIMHFQDYAADCQTYIDHIMSMEFGSSLALGIAIPSVKLQPCHDGGIIGAGILAGTVHSGGVQGREENDAQMTGT